MLAKVLGGPHDGLELDHETINRCCTLQTFSTPSGLLTFILMPAAEEWDRVAGGKIGKEELRDRLLPYFQVRTESGVEFHFDEGGRLLAEVAANPLPDEYQDEPVGVYYKCLCGDSENLGLTEPDCFVAEDAKGRNWICYPVTQKDVERLTLLDHVADVMQGDAALRRQGMAGRGTEVRVYFCQNEAELQEKLGES